MDELDAPDEGSVFFGSGNGDLLANNDTLLHAAGLTDALLEQLQRFRLPAANDVNGSSINIAPSSAGDASASAAAAAATATATAGRLPHNLTLIFNELQRFSFRSEASLQPYRTHGMTDEEYSRFVSDMWIGIVLTMLMVFIVLALCLWFLYHKFQQWKRQYNDAHTTHTLTHVVSAGALNLDGPNGTGTDELLPNYTLVSGLPTYDDALEQIRLSHSTNHLLINHQTLMKLFGSAPAVIGANSSGKDGEAATHTTNEYTFCANCSSEEIPTVTKSAATAAAPLDASSSQQMYLARIDRIDSMISSSTGSRRSSLANNAGASTASLPTTPNATTFITTGSGGHRFVCTTVQSPSPLLMLPVMSGPANRRRGSEMAPVTPSIGQRFRHRLLSLNPGDVRMSAAQPPPSPLTPSTTAPPPMPSALRARSGSVCGLPLRLVDVPSRSMGSLCVRRREPTTPTSPLTRNGSSPHPIDVRWSAMGVPHIDGGGGGQMTAAAAPMPAPENASASGDSVTSAETWHHRSSLF